LRIEWEIIDYSFDKRNWVEYLHHSDGLCACASGKARKRAPWRPTHCGSAHARDVLVGFGSAIALWVTIALVSGHPRRQTLRACWRKPNSVVAGLALRFAWLKSISNSADTWDTIMLNQSSASSQRKKIASMNLVSATVFLLPDKLALIQQLCAQKNRRISDLISEAVDDYLCKCS
jgi:hypothetical protein